MGKQGLLGSRGEQATSLESAWLLHDAAVFGMAGMEHMKNGTARSTSPWPA
jgi:hypothetical protein